MNAEEQSLIELNREFVDAEKRRDVPFFQQHLADELVFRRASGARVSKDQFLRELTDEQNTYDRLSCDEVEVIVLGNDIALASLRVQAQGKRGSVTFEGGFRNTRLFLGASGTWKCLAWFNSREAT